MTRIGQRKRKTNSLRTPAYLTKSRQRPSDKSLSVIFFTKRKSTLSHPHTQVRYLSETLLTSTLGLFLSSFLQACFAFQETVCSQCNIQLFEITDLQCLAVDYFLKSGSNQLKVSCAICHGNVSHWPCCQLYMGYYITTLVSVCMITKQRYYLSSTP